MIVFLLVFSLVGMAMPQRSPYLSASPQDYPGLLPRFRPPTSAPPPAGSALDNRIGGDGGFAAGQQPQSGTPFAEGTLFDSQTIDRVAQWPKDKQPFWYVNRQQIAGHKGQQDTANP